MRSEALVLSAAALTAAFAAGATTVRITPDWTATGSNSVVSLAADGERPLKNQTSCVRLTYRATGADPVITLAPSAPVEMEPFDTMALWVYGNNCEIFGNVNPTPKTDIWAHFVAPDGKAWRAHAGNVHHKEWHLFYVPLRKDKRKTSLQGARFVGLTVEGGRNVTDRDLSFIAFKTFVEKLPPYEWTPRPKRGVQAFKDAPQAFNVGEGRLPFPTVETTVVPVVAEDPDLEFRFPADPRDWSDLAFRYRKGAWIPLAKDGGLYPESARCGASVRFRRIGNSAVADIEAKGGGVEEVRFGGVGLSKAERVVFPYLTYNNGRREDRPGVLAARLEGRPLFVAQTWDWTLSNGSVPFARPADGDATWSNGGVRYVPRSDGVRNDCYERFVWSVSTDCTDVLPAIPNPPSPYRAVLGERVHRGFIVKDRKGDADYWRGILRQGAKKLCVTDNQTMWRDDFEGYSFMTTPAARKGGDKGQYDYTRFMIDACGFLHGPYLGWTDLTTRNPWWDPAQIMRAANGDLIPGWTRCYSPKVMWALKGCEELAPVIQRKFNFNCAYCDVHTQQKPWQRTDYDARCPGAAACATTFYAYGELMLKLREIVRAPVISEGSMHWLYAGLVDGNWGQDKHYGFHEHPWLVDFDLRRMHPLECDVGMGDPVNFYGDCRGPTPDRKSDLGIKRFLAATVAFGHAGLLLTFNNRAVRWSYSLQPLAAYYTKADAVSIRYADGNGTLHPLSDALLNGAAARSQIKTVYSDGTETAVNGSMTDPFTVTVRGVTKTLPPNGYFGISGDGKVTLDSEDVTW